MMGGIMLLRTVRASEGQIDEFPDDDVDDDVYCTQVTTWNQLKR